jgi:glucan phosphoethanolaminetransferase (alkaline phosphatase superfamily)
LPWLNIFLFSTRAQAPSVISDIKKQKTVGIFIVGETARADRFSLYCSSRVKLNNESMPEKYLSKY